MWIVWPTDLDRVEDEFRRLTRCETLDARELRGATWVKFRQRVLRFLSGHGGVRIGEVLRLGGLLLVVVDQGDDILDLVIFDPELYMLH